MRHLLLILLLAPLLAIANPKMITVQQAHEQSFNGERLLIDVRSENEWVESGVGLYAQTISMHQPGGLKTFKQQLLTLTNGKKDEPIALICAGGVRSSHVQRYLEKNGFSNVVDVNEGMLGGYFTKGWLDYGLPVKKYKKQLFRRAN